MRIRISACPIHRGKVIDGVSHSHTIKGDNITNEQIGSVVLTAINNARKMGWHLADPETWIRLELRQLPDEPTKCKGLLGECTNCIWPNCES